MKTYVIGDIHGGLKALHQVLKLVQPSQTDLLIFLGDYVDGWSESAQVLTYLIELNKSNNCIFIKGNHDVWCENWLTTQEEHPLWLMHGGLATIESYAHISERERSEHLSFFERMHFYHIDEKNRLFIHAGFTSMRGPEKEFHSRNYNWDRTLWETAVSMNNNYTKNHLEYPQRLKLFEEIYIGHTPTTYYNVTTPMNRVNVWNLDTGAAFTGKLSILDIESKEFFQSDVLTKLYPNENGRNK